MARYLKRIIVEVKEEGFEIYEDKEGSKSKMARRYDLSKKLLAIVDEEIAEKVEIVNNLNLKTVKFGGNDE